MNASLVPSRSRGLRLVAGWQLVKAAGALLAAIALVTVALPAAAGTRDAGGILLALGAVLLHLLVSGFALAGGVSLQRAEDGAGRLVCLAHSLLTLAIFALGAGVLAASGPLTPGRALVLGLLVGGCVIESGVLLFLAGVRAEVEALLAEEAPPRRPPHDPSERPEGSSGAPEG